MPCHLHRAQALAGTFDGLGRSALGNSHMDVGSARLRRWTYSTQDLTRVELDAKQPDLGKARLEKAAKNLNERNQIENAHPVRRRWPVVAWDFQRVLHEPVHRQCSRIFHLADGAGGRVGRDFLETRAPANFLVADWPICFSSP